MNMIYTEKIRKAIKFAIKTHDVYQKQKRKGKDIAYISHPLTVGIILAGARANENVVCAGILHDTIEDSTKEKKVTYEMIEERFGKKIADGVLSVTEEDRNLSWEERKKIALDHIKDFSHDSLLIKSADIIGNSSELVDDHARYGDEIFERFNAGKKDIIENQLKVINTIVECWKENPLAEDLLHLAKNLQMISAVDFMVKKPARVIEYKDYNENMKIECAACGWKGTPKSSNWIDTDSDFCLSVSCPVCEKMILVANYKSA